MADVNSLLQRIDAEFVALDEKIKKAQTRVVQEHYERQKRLEAFGKVLDGLRDVWRPRLEALAQRFGERVKVTPRVTPSSREGTFEFQSNLARIRLKFSACADRSIRKVILASDLEVVPILMQIDAHSELEFPVENVDQGALARWIDDRIVSFVRTYLALHENEHYLKDEMVEDPVAHIRFPKFAAGATLARDGKMHYFVNEETKRDFEKQPVAAPK
jgi:YHS domain-containing protein